MKGLVALIGLLLVVQFVENISGELIHARFGDSEKLSGLNLYGAIIQCSVEHNGINYSLYPEFNLTDATQTYDGGYCSFIIQPINFDHAGEWKIHTILRTYEYYDVTPMSNPNPESFYTTHTVYVEQEDDKLLLPTNVIHGEDGSYANIYFKDYFDNITKCYIVGDTNYYEIKYILGDNGNGTSAGLRLYEKCGVRIPITNDWRGNWKLVQESGKYKMQTGIITIEPHSKITSPEESDETWYFGSTDTKIRLNQSEIYSYCEVERPDGEVITFSNSETEYLVEKVRKDHAGTWKIRCLPTYSMNIVEQKIVVDVIDPLAIETTVTTTEDNMIHILCQTYVDEIQFCFFRTPNGTMINAVAGIGNEKYMYYGIGYRSIPGIDFAQCGITIVQPSNDDYGLWQCATKERNSNEILNASVSTAHLAEK